MNGYIEKNLVGVLFAILLLSGGLNLFAQDAHIVELTGFVEVRENDRAAWRTATVGTIVGRETTISTGVRSRAVISLNASTLTVSPLTVLTLEELTQRDGVEATTLFLRSGRVRADVTPPVGLRAEFEVRSPVASAAVRGTSFDFDGHRLEVDYGNVMLTGSSSGQRVVVGESQYSQIDIERQGRPIPPDEAVMANFRLMLPGRAGETGFERKHPRF